MSSRESRVGWLLSSLYAVIQSANCCRAWSCCFCSLSISFAMVSSLPAKPVMASLILPMTSPCFTTASSASAFALVSRCSKAFGSFSPISALIAASFSRTSATAFSQAAVACWSP